MPTMGTYWLSWMNYPELNIARAKEGGSGLGPVEGVRHYHVELDVRTDAAVLFYMGGAGEMSSVVLILGCRIEFPVLVLVRLGAVGTKKGAGREGGCGSKDSKSCDGCCKYPPALPAPERGKHRGRRGC